MKKIVRITIKILEKIKKRINQALIKLKFLLYQMEFGEREDDIYVVTYPKSGTTLMQMMLYQLTTLGNMDFGHINDVSPWIRNDALMGKPPKNLPSPRTIKTHDFYKSFEFGVKGRFIYVHRDGKDCAVSNWYQEISYRTTDLNFEEYLKQFLSQDYNWFTFTLGWFENKKKLPILYLHYEDLIHNFEESINKICQFLNIDPEKVDMKRVHERTRLDFMKKHEEKFGDRPSKAEKIYDEFIRKGRSGEGVKYFPENFTKAFDKAYLKYIYPLEQKITF